MIVVVAAALAIGTASVPNATPPGAARDVNIVIPVYNDRGVRALRAELRPYLRRGDTFLIVSGNQDHEIDTVWIDSVAEELRTFYPGTTILAGTSGMANIETAVAGLEPPVEGVAYIYEPDFSNEPEFSWDFPTTVALFEHVAEQARGAGLLAVGKPTGRPLLSRSLSEYGWDYSELSATVDDLFVQTQSYCHDSVDTFDEAIVALMSQFGGDADTDRWVPQLTLDVGSQHGVAVSQALQCAELAMGRGVDRFLMWWSPVFPNNAAAFLEGLRP